MTIPAGWSGSDIQRALAKTNVDLKVQLTTCRIFKEFERCASCTRSKTYECRFIKLRAINLAEKKRKIPHYIQYHGPDTLSKCFRRGPIQHQGHDRRHILVNIRKGLFEILQADVRERKQHGNKLRRRAPTEGVRHLCDICQTSIFNAHYMCAVCGIDFCPACYRKKWSKQMSRCTHKRVHNKNHMVPMERLHGETIDKILEQCDTDIDHVLHSLGGNVKAENADDSSHHQPPLDSIVYVKRDGGKRSRHSNEKDSISSRYAIGESGFLELDASLLTLPIFQHFWGQGRPVQIRNAMGSTGQRTWSPKNFIRKYGDQTTEVIDCETGERQEMKVEEFFHGFEDPSRRKHYDPKTKTAPVYKIKDWPPKDDFENAFPDLHRAFMKCLPAKEYCTTDGYFNISNRLPESELPPDLGPKMFIAYGSDSGKPNVGTTNLHCDMADAVNIMCYSYATNELAGAVWDVYPYEALPMLRKFISSIARKRKLDVGDPIHDQWLYLDSGLRRQFEKEYGIKSWRIYQNPGDAVFIPAGCAHQVANNHSAVKCAYDFVSPENVDRCIDLTNQFAQVCREDALQIRNTLLFTWHDAMFG